MHDDKLTVDRSHIDITQYEYIFFGQLMINYEYSALAAKAMTLTGVAK